MNYPIINLILYLYEIKYIMTTLTTTATRTRTTSKDTNNEVLYTKEYFNQMQDDINLIKEW